MYYVKLISFFEPLNFPLAGSSGTRQVSRRVRAARNNQNINTNTTMPLFVPFTDDDGHNKVDYRLG